MQSLGTRLPAADIRLLTVYVRDGVVISLELHAHSRKDAPEYDALSYAWGGDISTTTVPCNGQQLEIRTNLFKALPYICSARPEPRTRPLWIDAICVNQTDIREKEMHVPLMGDVYENAARTLIWLGEAAADSDATIDNIESLTQKFLAVKEPGSHTVRENLASQDLPPPEHPRWDAMKTLLTRPWFYRLWVFQEVILSKSAVILVGHKSFAWEALVALHDAAMQAHLVQIFEPDVGEDKQFRKPKLFIHHIEFIRKLRRTNNGLHLSMLLTLSADREYSLPVDRIWALLGILNKKYQQMVRDADLIDYSPEGVSAYHRSFLNVMKFHIHHDKHIAMQLIENNLSHSRNPSLPSWCPDWHEEYGKVPLCRMTEAIAGKPGGRFQQIAPFMQMNEDDSLELCGFVADVVQRTTMLPGKNILDLQSFAWLKECLEIVKSTASVDYDVYPRNGPGPLSVPTTFSDGMPVSEARLQYQRAEKVLEYVLYPPGVLDESSAPTILRCNDRKFFRSKDSRLGIGPAGLQENDLLCAIYGARTIWALRPCQGRGANLRSECYRIDQHGLNGQTFELVGSVYSPALVKGQAWRGVSCEDMRRFRLR